MHRFRKEGWEKQIHEAGRSLTDSTGRVLSRKNRCEHGTKVFEVVGMAPQRRHHRKQNEDCLLQKSLGAEDLWKVSKR